MEKEPAPIAEPAAASTVGGSQDGVSGDIPTSAALAPELSEFLEVVARVVARAIANQRQAGLQYPVTDEEAGGVKCGQ